MKVKTEKTDKSEKEKTGKSTDQGSSGAIGKRKNFGGSSKGRRFRRGRFSGQRPPQSGQ